QTPSSRSLLPNAQEVNRQPRPGTPDATNLTEWMDGSSKLAALGRVQVACRAVFIQPPAFPTGRCGSPAPPLSANPHGRSTPAPARCYSGGGAGMIPPARDTG